MAGQALSSVSADAGSLAACPSHPWRVDKFTYGAGRSLSLLLCNVRVKVNDV